jgi:hypothetical protein
MPSTSIIFNDNKACVSWSKRTTTKGLRHIQMHENHVRENVENHFVSIDHIGGKVNMADLFTKEMKKKDISLNYEILSCARDHLLDTSSSSILRGVLAYFKILKNC